jgi:ketosteroid isomerase-like protein
MIEREELLAVIDGAYAARVRGDKAAMAEFWEPDATYRLAGEASMMPAVPVGPAEALHAVSALIDLFEFHELERVSAVIEGLTAAVHWRVKVSAGGPRFEAELFDLWQFSERGKAASLLQFTDTALIVRMLA